MRCLRLEYFRSCVAFGLFSVIAVFSSRLSADTIVGGDLGGGTWTLAGSPYVVTSTVNIGSQVLPGATLVIEAGVVVKFNQNTGITVGFYNSGNQKVYNGSLKVLGTASAPVLFTANTTSPSPGYWSAIGISSFQANGPSEIHFATISYANKGVSTGATQYPVLIDHVRFENNVRGIYGGPGTMYANSFSGNTASTNNAIDSQGRTIQSQLCWWGDPSGPSGSVPGSGQSISAGITYEPWLTSTVNNLHYFSSVLNLNRTFNPTIQTSSKINFQTNQNGNWIANVSNSSGSIIRTFNGTGSSGSVSWDGKNQSGVQQPNENYTYNVQSTSQASQVAAAARGQITIDTNKQLTISSFVASSPYFNSSTVLTGTVNYDDPNWTINIKNSQNVVVRTTSGSTNPALFTWDGRNGSGVLQPEGTYTAELIVNEGTSNANATAPIIIDRTNPVAVFVSPSSGWVSNIYQNGSYLVPIYVTATDLNFNRWDFYIKGLINDFGTTQKNNEIIATLNTDNAVNGSTTTYTLTVRDKANNTSTATLNLTFGNLSISLNGSQINSVSGGSVTHTTVVPFPLTQSIVVKNEVGSVVRNLITNVVRSSAGNFTDNWDGKNNQGLMLPDGAYYFISTVTAGSTIYVHDVSSKIGSENALYPPLPTSYDPWNNQPLTFTYSVSSSKLVTVVFSQAPYSPSIATIPSNCDPPTNICVTYKKGQGPGSYTFAWPSVDNTGRFRNDIKTLGVIQQALPPNGAILFGTKATISNLAVTPPYFAPLKGIQVISFNLTTFQNQSASIKIAILNQSSLSVLKNITLPLITPGPITVQWDGHADNGMFVAPGRYTITVTAMDPIGNSVSAQTLINIRY